MKLDDNLVHSFAESIGSFFSSKTESLKVNKETTHYGTVKSKDSNGCQVQLDGSTVTTPASLLVEADVGDRVAVLIKNRHATVTGNVTAPSMVMDIGRPGSYRVHVDGDEVTFLNGDGNTIASMKIQSSSLGNVLFLLAEKIGLRASRTNNAWVSEVIAKHGSDNNPQAALQVRNTSNSSYAGVYVSTNKVDVTASGGLGVNGSKTVLENNIYVAGRVTGSGTVNAGNAKPIYINVNVPNGYKLAGVRTVWVNLAAVTISGFTTSLNENIVMAHLYNTSDKNLTVSLEVDWFAVRASQITEQPVQEIVF